MEFPQVVELNVGGRHLTTSLATLTKYPDSMLAAMFSGSHQVTQDKDDRYFIDVDGDVFVHILNFLRLQTLPPKEKIADVKKYAEYFGIDELANKLIQPVLPSEDDLFAKWASVIPGYTDGLKSAIDQLKNCQIQDGYINIAIQFKPCENSKMAYAYKHQDVGKDSSSFIGNIFAIITVPTTVVNGIVHTPLYKTHMSVLAHDLQKMGIYLLEEKAFQEVCCMYVRLFKTGLPP